ncbi:hypothetical protein PBAL39_12760 [Pedobacter sp. BAL39]|nr:hypothetical protein PBAL39_12760 [Pedobacter sp. BAL39]
MPLSTKSGSGLDLSQVITLSQNLDASPISSTPNTFARIGVKIVGTPELIYSDVWKINR